MPSVSILGFFIAISAKIAISEAKSGIFMIFYFIGAVVGVGMMFYAAYWDAVTFFVQVNEEEEEDHNDSNESNQDGLEKS